MNKIQAIHQFTPTVALRDGVSNGLLFTQRLLKELGFKSEIYILENYLDINFKHSIHHINEYRESSKQVLFYHHSIGHSAHEKIMKFADKIVMVYHNITPSHFFKHDKMLQQLCDLGREQLAASAPYFYASIGDSNYNVKELSYYDYPTPTTLALLLDLQRYTKHKANQQIIDKYSDLYNIIFVGRIVQNKVQHQLIDTMYALKQKGFTKFKLHIIGGVSQPEYMNFIANYAKDLEILEEVTITGKVNDEDLAAYYNIADLYLSLSDHEGFGIPLIEASLYKIPVLAYEAGALSTTLPKEALLQNKAPSFVAKKIIEFKESPSLKKNLLQKQEEKLEEFSHENTLKNLSNYLKNIGLL